MAVSPSFSSSCSRLCCRGSEDGNGSCNCHDCKLADLNACLPNKDDPNSKCEGGCKVLQMHCLGLLPESCSSSGGQVVDRENIGAPGGDEGVRSDGQAHVFTFYQRLTDKEKQHLDHDFNNIQDVFFKPDFVEATQKAAAHNAEFEHLPPTVMEWDRKLGPKVLPGGNVTYVEKVPEHKVSAWRVLGLDMYAKGYIGIVIMCGGLDSRLGQGLPKGILDFGLLSGKSILQLYAERIRRLQVLVWRRCSDGEPAVRIPLYIMCNDDNYIMLQSFFQENDFFGLHEHDVTFFKQKNSPIFDQLGRFAMVDKHKIRQEPCGNGYLFQALAADGFMQDVKSRSATHLFVISIDNVLGKIGDPTFVGFIKQLGVEAGMKVIRKRSPYEALGVLTTRKEEYHQDIDGDTLDIVTKLKAVNLEFNQMSEDMKTKRAFPGSTDLAYDSGNLSQYCFKVSFVRRVHTLLQDRWHLVPKSKTRLNLVTGEPMKPPPGVCNVFRPEQFIFDCFEFTKGVAALQVPREEYAVIKNLTGVDSAQSALSAMGKLHQLWIKDAGGEFAGNRLATDREDSKCEVSPLVSYEGEDLRGQFWMPIELPFYLPSQSELSSTSAVQLEQGNEDSLHFLDQDTQTAKMQVDAELKFQVESLIAGKTKDSDKERVFEEADSDEQLPPTPHHRAVKKDSVVEEVVKEEVVVRKTRHHDHQDDRNRHVLDAGDVEVEVTDEAEYVLSPRSKDESHHALSSRTWRLQEKKERDRRKGKANDEDVDRNPFTKGPGAKALPGRRVGGARAVYSDRANALGEHWDGEAPSLRCMPKFHHGLEKSEYGRRRPMVDYGLSSFWSQKEDGKAGTGRSSAVVLDASPQNEKSAVECAIS